MKRRRRCTKRPQARQGRRINEPPDRSRGAARVHRRAGIGPAENTRVETESVPPIGPIAACLADARVSVATLRGSRNIKKGKTFHDIFPEETGLRLGKTCRQTSPRRERYSHDLRGGSQQRSMPLFRLCHPVGATARPGEVPA